MSSRKQRQTSTASPPPPPEATLAARTLPSDLLLEIVARSDAVTLIRCAACCKPLRRDILSPAFVRRVCSAAVVPPRLCGFLPIQDHNKFTQSDFWGSPPPTAPPAAFSLAHPATPAAAELSEKHLAPLLSRGAGDLPLTSRNGVVALQLRDTNNRHRRSGICVYDPMTGDRTFVPDPPEMGAPPAPNSLPHYQTYVLLTASDGIGCSFLLLMADFRGLMDASSSMIRVKSTSSVAGGRGKWSPATSVSCDGSHGFHRHPFCSTVVLGGSIHWLMVHRIVPRDDHLHVLTYNVGAATAGRIELPMDRLPKSYMSEGGVRLASTADGMLTMLFRETEGLKISVWLLSADAGWAPQVVIDVETPLRCLMPWIHSRHCDRWIRFESLWERSGVLLFSVVEGHNLQGFVVLDIETKEMRKVDSYVLFEAIPFEVDLESRLLAMKNF